MTAAREAGFTLIESLAALAILAVASAGLIRAADGHADVVRGVQDRTIAGWVAANRLVEIRLGLPAPVAVTMAGRRWQVATRVHAATAPGLMAIEVAAGLPDRAPLVRLKTFVAAGENQ